MRVLFLASVLIHPRRGYAYPAIEDIRNGPLGSFPCVWVHTLFDDLRRVAVGLCEVNKDQLAALKKDHNISVVELLNGWRTLSWRAVPNSVRVMFLSFAKNHGLIVYGDPVLLIPVVIEQLTSQIRQASFAQLDSSLGIVDA